MTDQGEEWTKKAVAFLEQTKNWVMSLSVYKQAGMIIGLGLSFLFNRNAIFGLLLGFAGGYLYEKIRSEHSSK